MITINNMVACKPLENTAVKSRDVGSLKLGDFGAGGTLIPLTTVVEFAATVKDTWIQLKAGSRVYVKGDCIAQPWPKALCTCVDVRDSEGKETKFVLVPIDQIVMYHNE
jgi:hypothetical protein